MNTGKTNLNHDICPRREIMPGYYIELIYRNYSKHTKGYEYSYSRCNHYCLLRQAQRYYDDYKNYHSILFIRNDVEGLRLRKLSYEEYIKKYCQFVLHYASFVLTKFPDDSINPCLKYILLLDDIELQEDFGYIK